ncbi:MAG: SIS domain-containing protein [Alphaproteobacteria bacterium]|nr:SIS domain-containing protein [Alphaproteobacteria bacterium]
MGVAEELRDAPSAVRRQREELTGPLAGLVTRLKSRQPKCVVTCARGSSAHAATFAKHLIELHLGIPAAAMAPNIATVYRRSLRLDGQLFLVISQSGRSDDLVEAAAMARNAGALTAAVVNDAASPLASTCEFVLPIAAGPELSVAATKTFVATLAAVLRLVAVWTEDERLSRALDRLPERLVEAAELNWSGGVAALSNADSLIAIGRGPTLAIAREAALKLKEIANRHAEAFSGAEFLHGPVALVEPHFPILMFMPEDEAAEGMVQLAADLAGKGAALLIAGARRDKASGPQWLPALAPDHPETDAVCLIQSFYAMMVRLAEQLGIDPDRPRHLQKVTRTR